MKRISILNSNKNIDFVKEALEIFQFQAVNNPIYRSFLSHLNSNVESVNNLEQIPFLPIQFFKSHQVISTQLPIQKKFTSSGTTGDQVSTHFVQDLKLYEDSFRRGFTSFYGPIDQYTILALLPSYLEREGSSLIYMVQDFIKESNMPMSGFYLNNLDDLAKNLRSLDASNEKVLLIGVAFALLDLVEKHQFQLKNTLVMETGGMKGQRKELIREELHELLSHGFGVKNIHSEYGMTELLSQAYSSGDGVFKCTPTMKVMARDTEDALEILAPGMSGGLNIIDLANRNSCSFIATQDLGRVFEDGSFEVIGRFDHSDIRGCNLMVL